MPAELVTVIARKKAAYVRWHGPDDERTITASSQLRVARLLRELESLTDAERAEVAAALAAAR